MSAVMERVVVSASGVEVPEFEAFQDKFIYAIGEPNMSSTVLALESLDPEEDRVAFTWWVSPTPLVAGHERALCRFFSERLVEQWQSAMQSK